MSLKERFKSIQIMFMALLVGVVLFFAVVHFALVEKAFLLIDFSDPLFLVTIFFSPLNIVLSSLFFVVLSKKIKQGEPPETKLQKYQAAKIVSWAVLEGAMLFNIVGYLLGGNQVFIVFFLILLLFFLTKVPSKEKLTSQAKFTENELKFI